ncbi:MAG TPA: GAF domain-containing protein [Thermodesulfobacteriota bacterium]
MQIDYAQLDTQVAKDLNTQEGSLFVLVNDENGNILEFVYPTKLRGNLVPVNSKSIVGKAVASGKSYIVNDLKKEKNVIVLDWLMRMGMEPVQKVITYPVMLGGRIIAVLMVVRRGDTLTQAPDFGQEDIERLKAILDNKFSLRLAAEMGE